MPDDLKTMLAKVVQSHGRRKFFFAYGTGKRTDGNGDGHLIVAGKKPKKQEVQAACACQAFFEGVCWSSSDDDIVFFQAKGTKLGAVIIAKMALTAKKQTGRHVDFRIPTPAEESRVATLAEGDEAQPEGQASSPPPTGPERAAGDAQARWLKRREALEPAYLAALKDQRGDATKMRAVFAFAAEKADAAEYDRALVALNNLEKLLAAAAPVVDRGAEAAYQQRLTGLVAQVTQAGVKGAALAEMKLAITGAQAFARKPDLAKANATLDRLESLLKQAATARDHPAKPEKPSASPAEDAFRKQWATARSNLKAAIDTVSDQLIEFAGALMESNEANLVWIAEEGLSQMLSELRDTAMKIDRATSKTPAKVAAKARPAIVSLRKQLQNARVRACDDNKLGVTVTIHDTVSKAIKRLEDTLAQA